MELKALLRQGRYVEVLVDDASRPVLEAFVEAVLGGGQAAPLDAKSRDPAGATPTGRDAAALCVGLAALAAFLQVNVTGPVVGSARQLEELLGRLEQSAGASSLLRRASLASLSTDGVSVYPYTPQVELFCLARWVLLTYLSGDRPWPLGDDGEADADPAERSLAWLQLRVHMWHYKLLTEPNPGPGSVFNKMTQWSDLPSLQEQIQQCLAEAERQIGAAGSFGEQDRVQFLLEKTQVYSMLGQDARAQDALDAATALSRFEFVLAGALGKRTRFQEKSTSQLVVLARSASGPGPEEPEAAADAAASGEGAKTAVPQALPLDNDTLLETIDFSDAKKKTVQGAGADEADVPGQPGSASVAVPESLRDLPPDEQPQLSPLDQIILLSVATLKDAFSPADALTLEEILPYATRVLSDPATNWQIYSQALIVRSRIELHRSRTVERGVLQMQAMVDQVVVDATAPETRPRDEQLAAERDGAGKDSIPAIQVTAPGGEEETPAAKPTSFLPAPTASEQAPPQARLRYVHALSTPPRWHLEAELAFAWAGVGSLVSALEIFKRLRLWAEVALCLASSSAMEDEGGRGAGGEEKARGLLRWQLFHASDSSLEPRGGEDGAEVDVLSLKASDFQGPERDPAPPNAPRLFCILGDIEVEPRHYERAWALSKGRYSRAQRSLGEHYLQQRDWEKARDAYQKAVTANRLNPQFWSRLGDINLRMGRFADAAEAFRRAIGAASDAAGGEDARTWSNLGSALYSLYEEAVRERQDTPAGGMGSTGGGGGGGGDDDEATEGDGLERTAAGPAEAATRDPEILLAQSLAAFKRGATIAHDNWRIWDNVITLAARARPPVVGDIVLALNRILTTRKTEDGVDQDVLRLLLNEAVLAKPRPANGVPARGTQEKAVCDLVENMVVPLTTKRSELWALVARERVWRGDLAGAIDAAEKGWRAAVGGASTGTLGSTLAASHGGGGGGSSNISEEEKRNWLENADAWDTVVARTDELVSILENYGPDVAAVGTRWKSKARSALRSVMGKARERWEGSAGWATLENLLAGLQ